MPYTLGQAAAATGKSKPTLLAAIKKGRISASKDELGRYQIDPAELHRVYPPTVSLTVRQRSESNDTEHQSNTASNPLDMAEIARLKAQVEGLEKLCRQVEQERDRVLEQNTRLTALLPPPAPPPQVNFWRLFFPFLGGR